MPSLVIPDTVRVSLVWALTGVEFAVNVIHYIVPPGQVVSNATATDLANDIQNPFVSGALDTFISEEVDLSRITVRDIRTANLPEFGATTVAPGTSASQVLPLQIALVATLRTALAGRSYRGRFYMPGFAENANLADGTCDGAASSALETWLTAISSPTVQGNLWSLAVMSPTLGESNPVTAIDVRDNVWDTQRRRSYPGI